MPIHTRTTAVVAAAATTALLIVPLVTTGAQAAVVAEPVRYDAAGATLALDPVGSYQTGVFDESAAEIVESFGDRLFVVDAQAGAVTVLDYSDPADIVRVGSIVSDGVANSVAVRSDGLGVIALEAPVKTDPGHLVFFDATAADPVPLGQVEVGALPDMVTITPDGRYAVAAIEGEPADDFVTDPEGSVAVVTLPATRVAPAASAVRVADFHAFEQGGTKVLPDDVRVFGPDPDGDLAVSRNLEPEYVTIDPSSETAYVSLQEANALAEVDLADATVTGIRALGFADHSLSGHGIDPSDRDGGVAVRTFAGLRGMYQPDTLAAYRAGDATYLVTANEGDAREWGDYSEVSRVANLADDGDGPVCASLAALTGAADLGRLNVTTELGYDADAGCYDELYAFGGRSFSIWSTDGTQVFDSGDAFEQITATAVPDYFNANHTASTVDNRSDDKGPEPEALAIGELDGRTYAFIGFERVGGIAVFDVTDPAASAFVTYVNNRDFSVSPGDAEDPASVLPAAGDLGPEGIAFIPAAESATGRPLLAVANEVSGTTTVFSITDPRVPVASAPPVITGTPDVGAVLTADPGTWASASATPTFSYQWLRDGTPIPGATDAEYRVARADQGAALSVRVTAAVSGVTASADSSPVTVRYAAAVVVLTSPLIARTTTPVTATVTVLTRPRAVAGGTVTLTVAGRDYSATVTRGVARVPLGVLPAGVQRIAVVYSGDATVSPANGGGVAVVRNRR